LIVARTDGTSNSLSSHHNLITSVWFLLQFMAEIPEQHGLGLATPAAFGSAGT
jgi:hypothetical protein